MFTIDVGENVMFLSIGVSNVGCDASSIEYYGVARESLN